MQARGINPELECFDAGMINYAKYLIAKGILQPPFYFNILLGNVAGAQADLMQIGLLLHSLPSGALCALAGFGAAQLKVNTIAVAEGGGVRVGLEDNIWFDAGRTQLATNIMLVKRAHEIAQLFGRRVMKPATFGKMWFYNKGRLANG